MKPLEETPSPPIPPQAPLVCVVVLCWNDRRWLGPCLDSLREAGGDIPFRILVVDNGSSDGCADFVRKGYPDVDLLVNPRNLGFAGGNNAGIERALEMGARYVVLLNVDTLVRFGWLRGLVKVAEANPQIGILSPFQYDYEGEGFDPVFEKLLQDNTPFYTDRAAGSVPEYYEVPTVIGAAMVLRRDLVRKLGAFDPAYFIYFEEKDLCRRLHAAGYTLAVVPESGIGHWHGQLHADASRTRVNVRFLRNRQIFILKDPTQPFWKNLYVYLRYGLPNSLMRRYDTHLQAPGFWRALRIQGEVVGRLPQIAWRRWQDRRRVQRHRYAPEDR